MADATNKQTTDEEEEDYMGDLSLFLPPETTAPPKSSKKDSSNKIQNSESSNKKPKTLNWQEQRKLNRAQKQEEEDKKTLASLESAIPQSNIGFKLLKQMGYTPGSALGKEGLGRAEPVGLEIRRTRAGIGREDPRKEKRRREEERVERKSEEELMAEFGWRQKEQWRGRRVVVSYRKAKAALEQLENKEVVVEAEKDEEDGEDEEEEEEEITEEDLQDILTKLREEYQYCLFCGCRYESMEGLLSNCPGRDEDDH